MHFPIEFLLLGLVGEGTKWIGGKGWLPPKESGMPFKSRGKVGYLDADGKPALDEEAKPLSYEEKMNILEKDKKMRDAEFTASVMKKHKDKLVPTSLTDEQIDKLKPRKEKATITRDYGMNKYESDVQYDIYDDRVAVKKEDAARGYVYQVQMFVGRWETPPSKRRGDGMPSTSFKTKKEATEYAKRLLKLRVDLTRLSEDGYAKQAGEQFRSL